VTYSDLVGSGRKRSLGKSISERQIHVKMGLDATEASVDEKPISSY
jgi:hypothetical protein